MAQNNSPKQSLKKHERLKSKILLDRLFAEGISEFAHPIKILYQFKERTPEDWPLLFSITVPKKKIKSAVKRNLVKRKIREAYRLQKAPLQELLFHKQTHQLFLMLIYIENNPLPYADTYKAVTKLLKKLTDAVSSL